MSDSIFKDIQEAPPDPIFGANRAFQNDPAEKKVNLTIGVYRDEKGQPHKFQCVKDAELKYNEMNVDHEYLSMSGYQKFIDLALEFSYSKNSTPLKEKRIAAIQSISGTGAIRIGMRFLSDFYTLSKEVYVPTPTWGNHLAIAKGAGLVPKYYKYYNEEKKGVDFNELKKEFDNIDDNSIIIFHACAHNPTGCDLNKDEWKEIVEILKKKKLIPLIDMAYQGFATGDPENDAYAPRLISESGLPMLLCQSFAKNLGLYGERVGCLSIVTASEKEAIAVKSQLAIIGRREYSNPPKFGAYIATIVMSDEQLTKSWLDELKNMAGRIKNMRMKLISKLKELGSSKDWSFIGTQNGMFSYTGLTKEQVKELREKFHIYLLDSGRANIAGLNESNIDYVANAIHEVTK